VEISDFKACAGYVLARAYWGNGYTSEALDTLREQVLSIEGIYRFYAFCDVENKASARVMEKAGLQKEGLLRRFFIHPNISNEPRDCYVYAATV
jgi:RimJ/RimL family protein N-acetyltransferase